MSKKKEHNFNYLFLSWPVCINCGLIYLKNKASNAEARKKCEGE
jgi:hypothetical protein